MTIGKFTAGIGALIYDESSDTMLILKTFRVVLNGEGAY